jgi:hypothetical protein
MLSKKKAFYNNILVMTLKKNVEQYFFRRFCGRHLKTSKYMVNPLLTVVNIIFGESFLFLIQERLSLNILIS